VALPTRPSAASLEALFAVTLEAGTPVPIVSAPIDLGAVGGIICLHCTLGVIARVARRIGRGVIARVQALVGGRRPSVLSVGGGVEGETLATGGDFGGALGGSASIHSAAFVAKAECCVPGATGSAKTRGAGGGGGTGSPLLFLVSGGCDGERESSAEGESENKEAHVFVRFDRRVEL